MELSSIPLAILTRDADLLGKALTDDAYQAAMTARLGAPFITALTGGATAQSSQTGDLSQFTAQQQADFREMERLTAGARRTARLTRAAAEKHAAELQTKGWIPADTAALGTAIEALAEIAPEHEEAEDERLGLTNEKIIAANALYADCLAIQNAARLSTPSAPTPPETPETSPNAPASSSKNSHPATAKNPTAAPRTAPRRPLLYPVLAYWKWDA